MVLDTESPIFLTNLIGVSSNDGVGIRKSVREAQGKIVVTRNTLFKKAGAGTSIEEFVSDLKGPHALAFAFEDAAAVAKALNDASEDHEVVELKAGVLNGEVLSKEQLVQLANLPSREEMLGTLLATMNAPISAFARVLNSIKENKENGVEAAPAEEAAAEAPAAEGEE